MKCSERGFTLIEILVVITVVGILAAIALPNYIKAKDKAKEVEAKVNLHTIQLALERYNTDHREYPPFLLGGDIDGWSYWHAVWNQKEANINLPANNWIQDALVEYNYITSYPANPFIDGSDGQVVIDATAPFLENPKQGEGDPRFGFRGNIMGNGLDDPAFFEYIPNETMVSRIEIKRTLDRGGVWDPCDYGYPSRNAGWGHYPGLYYNFGGQYNTETGKTIIAFWPGNFFYRAASDIQPNRSGWSLPNPNWGYLGHVSRYMLGVWGSHRDEGMDVIRLQERIPNPGSKQLYWRYPPPFPDPPDSGFPRVSCSYAVSSSGQGESGGGLPAVFGGGGFDRGPAFPADRDSKHLGHFIYGAPDGLKDGVILTLDAGNERSSIID